MKKLMAMLAVIVMASYGWAAETNKTVKMLFRDYGVTDTKGVGALSLGACSWTDKDDDFVVGVYGDFKLIMLWDEKVNLGIGFVAKSPPDDAHYRMDLRMETSLTTHWFDCLELGVWYAPFWGTIKDDDPWGLMAGYYWKF